MSSMRDFITPQRIANDVMMTSSVFKGAFLLTEGNDDIRVFSNLCM